MHLFSVTTQQITTERILTPLYILSQFPEPEVMGWLDLTHFSMCLKSIVMYLVRVHLIGPLLSAWLLTELRAWVFS